MWIGISLLVLGRIGAILSVADALAGLLLLGQVPRLRVAVVMAVSFALLWLSSFAFRDRFVFTQAALQVVAIAGLAGGVGVLTTALFKQPDLLLSRVGFGSVVLLAAGATAAYSLRYVQRRRKRVVT